jgi:hypothetical protein
LSIGHKLSLKGKVMKRISIFSSIALTSLVVGLVLPLGGCAESQPPVSQADPLKSGPAATKADMEREAAFAKLSADDRVLAEAQGYCVVSGEPLGSMGAPLKVMVKDQTVWICCAGCESAAESGGDETLAKAEEYKTRVQTEAKN